MKKDYEELNLKIVFFDANVFLAESVGGSYDNNFGDFSGGDDGQFD